MNHMDIKRRIMQSLRPRRDGLVLRSDVHGFGGPSQVSAAIKTLVEEGLIVRLDRGVYAKPGRVDQVGKEALLEQAMLKMENLRTQNRWRDHKRALRLPSDPTATYVRQLAKREGGYYVYPNLCGPMGQSCHKLSGR